MKNIDVDKSHLPNAMNVLWKYGDFIAQNMGNKGKASLHLDGYYIEVSRQNHDSVKIEATKNHRALGYYITRAIKLTYNFLSGYFLFPPL